MHTHTHTHACRGHRRHIDANTYTLPCLGGRHVSLTCLTWVGGWGVGGWGWGTAREQGLASGATRRLLADLPSRTDARIRLIDSALLSIE
jgi:hypothetical protein